MSNQNKLKKWRIALINDQNHDVVFTIHRTRRRFIFDVLISVFLVVGLIYALIAYTPIRTLIPGYPDANTRRAAIQTALRVDSLQSVVSRWELYSTNLLRVVEGQEPIKIDSLIGMATKSEYTEEELRNMQIQDSLLRVLVTEQEQAELTGKTGKSLTIDEVHFFTPVKGAVYEGFAAVTHPYVDIKAPANSVVMAVLDGVVVYTGWSDQDGYTVVLQHAQDIITVYRNNQKLLARTGDKVAAGASIALVGTTGSVDADSHLKFELWHRGESVDAAKYIKF